MRVLRKDYYHNAGEQINVDGFDFKNLVDPKLINYTNANTLQLNKKEDSFSTFDDGLLFTFPAKRYKHLTYYCRTETPEMDTCNVKLFKLGAINEAEIEEADKEWMPPLS